MYDIEHVYERIERAWKSIGCKNAKQFSEYAREHGYYILEQTISKWHKGTKPSIENLLDICNVCGCDIDYLLDKNKCMTRQITDIQKETGLSEEACNILTCKDVPSFVADGKRQVWRDMVISHRGSISWLFEHGLINIISDATDYIDFIKPENSSMIHVPHGLYDLLDYLFSSAIKTSITYEERRFTYMDLIAMHLINMNDSKALRDIKKQLGNNYYDIQTLEDLGNIVKDEAIKRETPSEDCDIIANIAMCLTELSMGYFQAKYETQLHMQIAVNRFSDLLNDYKRSIEENSGHTDSKI